MAAGRREIESLTGHKAGIISTLPAITIGRRRLRAHTDSPPSLRMRPMGQAFLPPRTGRALPHRLTRDCTDPMLRDCLLKLAGEYTGRASAPGKSRNGRLAGRLRR